LQVPVGGSGAGGLHTVGEAPIHVGRL